jgi:protocatechuate 3,4-dioxygenase beta subunit
MREVWSVRVSLYDYQWSEMEPRYVWLASTYTNDAGVFTFDPVYNYDYWDEGDPDTRLDLFIVVEAFARESGVSYSAATYFNGLPYTWNEPCPGCPPLDRTVLGRA